MYKLNNEWSGQTVIYVLPTQSGADAVGPSLWEVHHSPPLKARTLPALQPDSSCFSLLLGVDQLCDRYLCTLSSVSFSHIAERYEGTLVVDILCGGSFVQERWVTLIYLYERFHVIVEVKVVVVVVDLESVELVDLNQPALMDSLPHRFALMGGDQGELFLVKTPLNL